MPPWQNARHVAPRRVVRAPHRRAGAAAAAPVAAWLFACCALVFAMVVVGGVTRLTHSGLSIVEWQPIVGTLPPLSDAALAGDVRQVPAHARVPAGQPRHDARRVQGHLLVGVLPPAARAPDRRRLPRAAALVRRAARHPDRAHAWKLAGIFVLGGLQGAMGWYMVQERPRRRPARVAVPAHRAPGLALADLRGDVLGRRSSLAVPAPRDAGRGAAAALRGLGARRRRARLRDGADRRASSPASAPASPTTPSR